MNLQRGDKGIGWTDATWNPYTGCLSTKEQCAARDVCYARRVSERFGRSFEPAFHPKRLEQPYKLKKPLRIFVCSMGELFGPWVPWVWIERILQVVYDNPHHIFQFLTKFPRRYHAAYGSWPPNAWLGTTINTHGDWLRRTQLANPYLQASVKFVSAEPLLNYLGKGMLQSMDWVIIGAQTNPEVQPRKEWVDSLVEEADDRGIPVFMKSNLRYGPTRREWPSGG